MHDIIKSKVNTVLFALALLFVVVAVHFFVSAKRATLKFSGEYQAIFLTNDQVYFGKVSGGFLGRAKKFLKLTDAFYLKSPKALQSHILEDSQRDGGAPPLTLVRLGDEVPGSLNEMIINYSHIIFIEDLKPTSSVLKAINDFKNKN